MSYRFVDSFRAGPGWNLDPSWSCSKAVYKPVWHIPLLSVQWINSWWWPDELSETRRVSWQNKLMKLVLLVGFITKHNYIIKVYITTVCLCYLFYLFIYLFMHLFIYIYIYLFIYLFIYCNWVRDLTVPMHLGHNWWALCVPYQFMVALLLCLSSRWPTDLYSSYSLVPRRSPDTHVCVKPKLHIHNECGPMFLPLLYTSYTVDCLTALCVI